MKYQHRENGKVLTVVEFNEKTKVYLVKFEDGKETNLTSSTLKRWYLPVNEEASKEASKPKKTSKKEKEENKPIAKKTTAKKENTAKKELVPMPGIEKLSDLKEEYSGDGTPLAEVGKEIAKQAKEKAAKVAKDQKKEVAKKEKKVKSSGAIDNSLLSVKEVCEANNLEYTISSTGRYARLLYNGKSAAIMFSRKDGVRLYVKDSSIFSSKIIIKVGDGEGYGRLKDNIYVSTKNLLNVFNVIISDAKKEAK